MGKPRECDLHGIAAATPFMTNVDALVQSVFGRHALEQSVPNEPGRISSAASKPAFSFRSAGHDAPFAAFERAATVVALHPEKKLPELSRHY